MGRRLRRPRRGTPVDHPPQRGDSRGSRPGGLRPRARRVLAVSHRRPPGPAGTPARRQAGDPGPQGPLRRSRSDCWRASSGSDASATRLCFAALEDFHVLTPETVRGRFHYRTPGLWVLGTRIWRRAGRSRSPRPPSTPDARPGSSRRVPAPPRTSRPCVDDPNGPSRTGAVAAHPRRDRTRAGGPSGDRGDGLPARSSARISPRRCTRNEVESRSKHDPAMAGPRVPGLSGDVPLLPDLDRRLRRDDLRPPGLRRTAVSFPLADLRLRRRGADSAT